MPRETIMGMEMGERQIALGWFGKKEQKEERHAGGHVKVDEKKAPDVLSVQTQAVMSVAEGLAISGDYVDVRVLVANEDPDESYIIAAPRDGVKPGETKKLHVRTNLMTHKPEVSFSTYTSAKSRFNPDTNALTANWKEVVERKELPELLKLALGKAEPTNAIVQADKFRTLQLPCK